jgi:hypothetical protein
VSTKNTLVLAAALVTFGGPLALAAGSTVYTNEADFVAAIGVSPVFVNDFPNRGYNGPMAHPFTACQNTICYSVYSEPPVHLVAFGGSFATAETNDQIVVTFTTGNVWAAGGRFYVADENGVPTIGSSRVSVSDGTAVDLVIQSNAVPMFVGFVSSGGLLTSLVLQGTGTSAYAAMTHLTAASVLVPSPIISKTAGNNLMISWAAGYTNCSLQSSPDPLGGGWTELGPSYAPTNGSTAVVLPVSADKAFFRLQKQ